MLAGYLLLLSYLAKRNFRPVERRFTPRTVSVLVAVRNGEKWIGRKVESILNSGYPRELIEIIVISDGSTDRTEQIAAEFENAKVLRVPHGGKASALNAGLDEASGEILVFTDVRQALEPGSLNLLIESYADPSVGVVSGDLMIINNETHDQVDVGMYRRYESWIRDRLSDIDSMFGATGSYYSMRRSLAVKFPPDILLDDMYQPLSAFFRGYRTIIDLRARAFDFPVALDTEFRRKVRTLAGNYQLLKHYPGLLGPRNRMWLHFVSYKFGRLMLPFALIAIAVATIWLPVDLRMGAVGLQAGFYGLALIDPLVPAGLKLKRITSLVRTFVVLMAAALCALVILFVPARRLWNPTEISAKKLS